MQDSREHQNRVNDLFQTTASKWKDIYREENLYSRLYQQRMELVLSLVDEIGLAADARALEVGCGPGVITAALAEREYLVNAIDTVADMIEMTRKLADESGLGARVQTQICDIRDLCFADNSFDVAVVVGVTEWLDSLGKPLSEIVRVMKPGGYLIVTGDNSWSLNFALDPVKNPVSLHARRIVRKMLMRFDGKPASRYHLRSVRQLDSCLKTAGLKKIKRMTLGFGPFSFLGKIVFPDSTGIKIHGKLQALADRRWPVLRSTGHVYVAVARKPGPAETMSTGERFGRVA
jgi:ubiquinone/menaquinone biosynthesis C-methylase UbiE